MLYALINKNKAVTKGFSEITHNVYDDDMVVNENELRLLGDDIDGIARQLGGRTMTLNELSEIIKKEVIAKKI